jgi:hypothetical protein
MYDQPSAGKKLRFEDNTTPERTALFHDLGMASDMRGSCRGSFGHKSILKNSSAKKKDGLHNSSLESLEIVKPKKCYYSSESDHSLEQHAREDYAR